MSHKQKHYNDKPACFLKYFSENFQKNRINDEAMIEIDYNDFEKDCREIFGKYHSRIINRGIEELISRGVNINNLKINRIY